MGINAGSLLAGKLTESNRELRGARETAYEYIRELHGRMRRFFKEAVLVCCDVDPRVKVEEYRCP